MGVTDFLTKVEEIKAKKAEVVDTGDIVETFDDEFVPDLSGFTRPIDPVDAVIDTAIANISILDAYRMWTPKCEPKVGRKRESVMLSCPSPSHTDAHPSAWVNLDLDVGTCGGCGIGFDKFDIAAWGLGYDVPGYKGEDFPKLRRDMAAAFGVNVTERNGRREISRGTPALATNEIEEEVVIDTSVETAAEKGPGVSLHCSTPEVTPGDVKADAPTADPEPAAAPTLVLISGTSSSFPPPSIDWRSLVPEGTFLHQWLTTTCRTDLPEEYFFWLGLQMVGLAGGNQARLLDEEPVRGNLFIVLFGPSGIGKTRSAQPMGRLLSAAFPYDYNAELGCEGGVYLVPVPGSAEALVDSFSKPIMDPMDPKKVSFYAGVRGLVKFGELSELMGKASRTGSVIKPQLMEFYDGYEAIQIKSRGHGLVRAEKHFCSAYTTTQPGSVRNLLNQADADSGFLNRWIYAMGPHKKLVSYGAEPVDVMSLVKPLQSLRTWTMNGRSYRLLGDAFTTYDTFFHKVIEPIRTSSDEETTLLTRSDLVLKKLILLFTINERLAEPTADVVERALEIFPYLRDTGDIVLSQIGAGDIDDLHVILVDKMREWQTEHHTPISRRDLLRKLPTRFKNNLTLFANVIQKMEQIGEIFITHEAGRSVRYALVN